jgi:hypothetical protein
VKWTFAKNEGGREAGFHDAGVETFKGNFDRYLARELIQNSLDARLDPKKPVNVKFQLLELSRKEIPGIDDLEDTFARCSKYWRHQAKAREFFDRAKHLAAKSKIRTLRIGDSNTTGVLGSDTDQQKDWYNLIRCAGSSAKSGTEGGSFGIGKNAPFAASQMRTVLYSTYTNADEHIFQGVAMLASHALSSGAIAQPTGYLGGKHGASIRSKSEIPKTFLRREHGTDIIVLGFPPGDSWQKDLVYAVLEHFWPAIEWGDLTVSVGNEDITRQRLPKLLQQFSGDEDFTASLYYQAYKNPAKAFEEKLEELKSVRLYLSSGDAEMPKRVAMVRRTGMVIFAKPFRSVIPFCGVFVCKNETGNRLLREMEPPRHDVWDADHPEKGQNKHIESEYNHFIRDCVKELAPVDNAKVLSLPGLNRFLPDDDETPEEAFDDQPKTKGESPDRSPLPEKIKGKKMEFRQPVLSADSGRTTKKPGGRAGSGGPGTGDRGKPPIPIQFRTFAGADAGTYIVSVRPEQRTSKKVQIAVWVVGDDQRSIAEVKSARLSDGSNLPISSTGLLGPLHLSNKARLHFEVRLREPIRVAMEVSAHET